MSAGSVVFHEANLIGIPRSDFVQPLRDFRKRTQRPQRARITSQLRMQLAKEGARFIGTGYVVAVMLDELPEGQSETIVLVRTGRQFPLGGTTGKFACREISGEIKIEREPSLCGLANQRSCRSHACDNGRRYEMDEHVAAIGDDLRRDRCTAGRDCVTTARAAATARRLRSSMNKEESELGLCGKRVVEHPVDAELVLAHAKAGVPEHVLQRHGDFAACGERFEEGFDLFGAVAFDARRKYCCPH